MYRYIIKKTFFMIFSVFAACMLTFMLMNVIPGSTAELMVKHAFVGLEQGVTAE
jgi:peptide/nickel transport system permease protein